MNYVLSSAAKECLIFIWHKKTLPIPWDELMTIGAKEKAKTLENLRTLGLIDSRDAFNMRGICHLVVDCKVPFSNVLQTFGPSFEPMKDEIEKARTVLVTQHEFDIFYHYNFKQYIEWDLFDENHNFLTMQPEQLAKTFMAIGLKVLDDGRIEPAKIMRLFNVPVKFIKDYPMSKEELRHIFITSMSYF